MKYKKRLYISTKLREKQIDIKIYGEELYIYIYIYIRNIYLFQNTSKLSISNNFSTFMIGNILWILPFSVSWMLTAFL